MQLTDRVKNCNGCGACAVGCKYTCIKMVEDEDGTKKPVVDENGCNKCNSCILYCPIFNPVELPEFEEFFDTNDELEARDMPKIYRQTMRSVKAGQKTEFAGTLCQIAALKSLSGDKLAHNLVLYPLYCDEEKRSSRFACKACAFYK